MVTKTKPELYTNILYHEKATIDTAATALSSGVNLNGLLLCGVTKAGIDWDAADITMQISPDGITYYNAYDGAGLEKTISVTTDTTAVHFLLAPSDFAGAKFIKFRSGTSATPVQQTEPQTLYISMRPSDQSKN